MVARVMYCLTCRSQICQQEAFLVVKGTITVCYGSGGD